MLEIKTTFCGLICAAIPNQAKRWVLVRCETIIMWSQSSSLFVFVLALWHISLESLEQANRKARNSTHCKENVWEQITKFWKFCKLRFYSSKNWCDPVILNLRNVHKINVIICIISWKNIIEKAWFFLIAQTVHRYIFLKKRGFCIL